MRTHLQEPPPDPRILLPDLPEPAAVAILCTLAKSPYEPFDMASDLAITIG
jgi:DNA-binding transcriptional ArsR family regulator